MFISLAFKNLLRNMRRTALVEVSIAFGALALVCSANFINGMSRGWAMLEIGSNTGAFQVEHRDYKEKGKAEPLKTTLEGATALVEKIAAVPGVAGAYGKLKFTGMVSNGSKSTFFEGVAVDVARVPKTLPNQEDLIITGKALGAQPGGVVLGADLAESLDIKIGDPVTIVVQTFHGGLNLTYGTLVGTKNGRHFPSTTYLEIRLDEAQKLLRVKDRVSQVVAGSMDLDAIPAVMERTRQAVSSGAAPLVLRGYPELIQNYAQGIASFRFVSMVVGLALFALVGGGIANMMAMAAMERRREIGSMRAMGMEKRDVRRLFLAEGLIVGALGAVSGVALGTAWTVFMAAHGGVHLPPAPGTTLPLAIIPVVDPVMSVYAVAMPTLVGLIAAWWPALAAAETSPAQALTEV